jgi:hypothetical protein
MKPKTKIPRNSIIERNPNKPISLRATAQGKRNAISRSKRIKRIATR